MRARQDLQKDFDAFEAFLRRKGLKMTQPRRKVAERIFGANGHLSAEDLVDWARQHHRGFSKASVYRTLALLAEGHLVDQHDFGQGRAFYERTLGRTHHDHLICVRCKRITEFTSDGIERLQDRIIRSYGFEMLYHSHKIFGLCQHCRMK